MSYSSMNRDLRDSEGHLSKLLDSQNVVVNSFVTMSARVVTVSVVEYLVILHLQVKASRCVSVRYRDIRELKRKLAGNFQIPTSYF